MLGLLYIEATNETTQYVYAYQKTSRYETEQAILFKIAELNGKHSAFDSDAVGALHSWGAEARIDTVWTKDVIAVELSNTPWQYTCITVKWCVSDGAAGEFLAWLHEWNTSEIPDGYRVLDVDLGAGGLFPPLTAQVLGRKGETIKTLVLSFTQDLRDVIIVNAGGVRAHQHVIVTKRFYETLTRGRMDEFVQYLQKIVWEARQRVDWTRGW